MQDRVRYHDEEAAVAALEEGETAAIDAERLDAAGRWYEATPLERALVEVKLEIETQVHQHCRLVLVLPECSNDLTGVRSGWDFDSLLGPMYLSLLWHVAAQREVRRCRYCHRRIPDPSVGQLFCCEREGVKNKCRYDYSYYDGQGKSNKEARKKGAKPVSRPGKGHAICITHTPSGAWSGLQRCVAG